jgi:hypothetical protein
LKLILIVLNSPVVTNRNGRIEEAGGGEDDDGGREDENLSHDQVFDGLVPIP